jgi:hypothetical protein
MNEEEKKAVEDIKKELSDEDRREYMSSWFAKDLDIAVNLIEKLQKENKELKKENEYNKILLDMNNNFTIDKKTGIYKWNVIEIKKLKDIIDRIDYDIKKIKELIEGKD